MLRLLLHPDWLVDGTGSEARSDTAVLISDGTIEAVGPAAELALPGVTPLRFEGATLLPGLINHHVHLNLPGDNSPFVPWLDAQSDASLALHAAANARRSLAAGITTVRDCGGRGTTVLDTRDAQTAGLTGGARIVSCGWPITISGGHTRQMGGEADGADALRRMVRQLVAKGADFIKVMASGGGTPGTLPQFPSFSTEELRVIVATAHDLGRRVTMHCIATASIAHAVAAGADLIEHAMFYSPDLSQRFEPAVAERLAKAGTPVTPTLQVARDMVEFYAESDGLALWQRRRERGIEIASCLRELGVPLLAGSDAGWRATTFDSFWKELDELVAVGFSPVQAIAAATGGPAQALGQTDITGAIRPGLRADLLVVNGDAAADIRCLRNVWAIFQNGIQAAPVDYHPYLSQSTSLPPCHPIEGWTSAH
jgi:imidazolonepropionase-like amidohydrolase